MNRILPALLLIILCADALAGVYKRTDAEGNVEYSDLPQTTKEKAVPLPPASTYTPPPVDAGMQTSEAPAQQAVGYESVAITQPADDQAIRENAGNVLVQFTSNPALQAGHRFVLLVDGKKMAEGHSSSLQLENLDRGTHNVQVQVVDASGQVIASSRPVTFHLQRVSILHRPGANPN